MAAMLSFSLPKPSTASVIAKSSSSPVMNAPAAAAAAESISLEEKFGRKGIKFLESSVDVPTVELTVRNGSSVKVQIPTAHVTSYNPKVYWKDDGFEEVLYTIPSSNSPVVNTAAAKGGIGLVFNELSNPNSRGSALKTSEWTLKDVDSDSIDALQVLISPLIWRR